MTEQILWLAIALMGVVIAGLIVAYSRQKKESKECLDGWNKSDVKLQNTMDKLRTDKDILIDEVKRLEADIENARFISSEKTIMITEKDAELSALKAKMPQQCGKCGKWTKPNPVIVEGKPMCQKCFAKRVEIETKQPEAPKPLDLSNIKPGTKVRLSNGTVAITELTDAVDEVKIDHFYNGSAKFFHHDGTAVNGSDIRIVEVVE